MALNHSSIDNILFYTDVSKEPPTPVAVYMDSRFLQNVGDQLNYNSVCV